MKIRIYSPFLPYPVTEGAYRVIFDQVFSLLALGHEVELVTWKNSPAEFEERSKLWQTQASKWPTPHFQYLGPQVDSRFMRVLSSCWGNEASPESFYYPKAILNRLAGLGPCDLAIYHYSFAHYWLRTPKLLPVEKRRVVHFHNLESDLAKLRFQNSGSLQQWLQKWVHHRNFEKLKLHERELSDYCQELWFLSPIDLAAFPAPAPSAMLRLIPPTFSSEISQWSGPVIQAIGQSKDQTILGFIGGFNFQPNIDSAQWILNYLVPALEKAGFQGKVLIAGRGAQAVIQPGVRSPLVEVLPDNFDVGQFFTEISWMLVPHLTGSGVRIKLLDALSKKIPVMATPSAVERLHPEIQQYPLIFSSDDPALWAEQAMRELPGGTRLKYQNLAFPQAMSGAEIYRNIHLNEASKLNIQMEYLTNV